VATRVDRRTEILDTAAGLFATTGVRTSLKDIADACGIQTGSLYHHFDSKEAIFVELVERYRADLLALAADARAELASGAERSALERIEELGTALAECGVRHRAALLLTLTEPPAGAGQELVRVTSPMPLAVDAAMLKIVETGVAAGEIRADLDAEEFADQVCQAMLHTTVGLLPDDAGAVQVASIRCHTLLHGIAIDPPGDDTLDRSAALRAVDEVIASWSGPEDAGGDEDEGLALLRAVARAEFGRRGYDATTIRDIAAAAGFSTASIYRRFASKDELLDSIMDSFASKVSAAWSAALSAPSTVIEKIDAISWANINVVDRSSDEFHVLQNWLREAPPSTRDQGWTFLTRLHDIEELLEEGSRTGEVATGTWEPRLAPWALFHLLWLPENLVRRDGPKAGLAFVRSTVLRGAATS
jgi:AcrR family transcriptional regulator